MEQSGLHRAMTEMGQKPTRRLFDDRKIAKIGW
jgi:hypothetical protein